MATVTKIGPLDYGRPMSLDEFRHGDYQEGYRYELIDGRLYVSPMENLPEKWVENWLCDKLKGYAEANPKVTNYVVSPGRVSIPGRPDVTTPEPDVLAYKNFPLRRRKSDLRWEDVSPLLVAEVLSADDPGKDLIRNVALYLLVPTIKEYWILDAREDADYPRMIVRRRRGKNWQEAVEVGGGETYTTPLLPGFALTLDTGS
jgi:Uma2 family endonuclease